LWVPVLQRLHHQVLLDGLTMVLHRIFLEQAWLLLSLLEVVEVVQIHLQVDLVVLAVVAEPTHLLAVLLFMVKVM
jgi:hypothetical protein